MINLSIIHAEYHRQSITQISKLVPKLCPIKIRCPCSFSLGIVLFGSVACVCITQESPPDPQLAHGKEEKGRAGLETAHITYILSNRAPGHTCHQKGAGKCQLYSGRLCAQLKSSNTIFKKRKWTLTIVSWLCQSHHPGNLALLGLTISFNLLFASNTRSAHRACAPSELFLTQHFLLVSIMNHNR